MSAAAASVLTAGKPVKRREPPPKIPTVPVAPAPLFTPPPSPELDKAAAALKKLADEAGALDAKRKTLIADVSRHRTALDRIRSAPQDGDPPLRQVRQRLEELEADLAAAEDRADELRDLVADAEVEVKSARRAYCEAFIAIAKPRQRALVASLVATFRSMYQVERELKEITAAARRVDAHFGLPEVPTAIYGQPVFFGDSAAVNSRAWSYISTLEAFGFKDLGGQP